MPKTAATKAANRATSMAKGNNTGTHGALTGDEHSALWSGRFREGPDAEAVAFETSINVDKRLAADDIKGSIAHATMLGRQGIIGAEDAQKIVAGLEGIAADLASGALDVDTSAEDIHSFVEATLTERIGEAGKRLHTGRSRNDQIALDERLYLRRVIPDLQNGIVDLVDTLVRIASDHTTTTLSGYTHMQRAQPGTLAEHLCAWAFPLVRDWGRFQDALCRIDTSPLGAGALQGSTLPLDREWVAKSLGFSGATDNTIDSVASRDFCIEFASSAAILQAHLSRMAEEVVLWATDEFSFVSLSERWSTGSSIMPQKKNPDFAELIRGRTGRVYGDLVSLLTMVKGLPLAYGRDLQEDKEPLFDALDTVAANVRVFRQMIATATWNVERMAASCEGGFSNATDLAEYLVKKGLPFRTAHTVAARVVRRALEAGLSRIEDLPLEQLQEESPLIEQDVYELLSPKACVENRKGKGSPAPCRVQEQLEALHSFCAAKRKG